MYFEKLRPYGLKDFFIQKIIGMTLDQHVIVGRVVKIFKNQVRVVTEFGEKPYLAKDLELAVGDWVVVKEVLNSQVGVLCEIIERQNVISRKLKGSETKEQLIAANVDLCVIVTSATEEFNIARIERYLTVVKKSDADAVIAINKADLADTTELVRELRERIGNSVPIVAISATTGQGIDTLSEHFNLGMTIMLFGSSGVGKSSIVNYLKGDSVQKVNITSHHMSKGQHTTTERSLIVMPSGTLLIDTPGMRELQLWADSDDVLETFSDIDELILKCKFSNCTHDNEPDCAIVHALENEIISFSRWKSFLKQQREALSLERRQASKDRKNVVRLKKLSSHRSSLLKPRVKFKGTT